MRQKQVWRDSLFTLNLNSSPVVSVHVTKPQDITSQTLQLRAEVRRDGFSLSN